MQQVHLARIYWPIGTFIHTSMNLSFVMSVGKGDTVTLDAPAVAKFPAVQEAHVADELAPVALEYVPPGQEVHSAAPVSAEPARVERIRS